MCIVKHFLLHKQMFFYSVGRLEGQGRQGEKCISDVWVVDQSKPVL